MLADYEIEKINVSKSGKSALRNANSGFVFFDRILDIHSDRFFLLRISIVIINIIIQNYQKMNAVIYGIATSWYSYLLVKYRVRLYLCVQLGFSSVSKKTIKYLI